MVYNPNVPQGLSQRQQNAWTDRARRMGAASANQMAGRWNVPAAADSIRGQVQQYAGQQQQPPAAPATQPPINQPMTPANGPADLPKNVPALNAATDQLSQTSVPPVDPSAGPVPPSATQNMFSSYQPQQPPPPVAGPQPFSQRQQSAYDSRQQRMGTASANQMASRWNQPRRYQ